MRVAILDLYNQVPNQGMKGILKILNEFQDAEGNKPIQYDIFDLRAKLEIPGLEYDAYISTGGPGDPHYRHEQGGHIWGSKWAHWMDSVIHFNKTTQKNRKTVFLICHSFQMMCIHTGAAVVERRNSPSFGIFPMHKTAQGINEDLFSGLSDPFYSVDSRSFQVLDPNQELMESGNMKILAYEKIRPHVPFDRAIMAIRFTDEIMGTQFHPEADAGIMKELFQTPDKKEDLIKKHGEKKYHEMMLSLEDPERISKTFFSVLPQFLKRTMEIRNLVLSNP